ncbi:MAG: metallophosphoesterase family protein [Adlercreutzia sp.]
MEGHGISRKEPRVAHRHHLGHPRLAGPARRSAADCDHIIHAGDICGLPFCASWKPWPVTAVLGNNDFDEYGSEVGHFAHPVLGGVRFLVGHKPGDVRVSFAGSAALAPGDPLPDVIIHGHTHVPELKTGPDARPAGLYLCPGAVYRPRSDFGRTIAKMDVEAGRILHTWVKNLDGKVLMEA